MTETGAKRLAAVLLILPLIFTAAAAVLLFRNRNVVVQVFGFRIFVSAFAVVFGGTGWLLASRRHANPIGWLFLVVGLAAGLQVLASEYAINSIVRSGGSLPLTRVFAWLQSWVWIVPVFIGAIVVPVLFPSGRLPSRKWKWFVPTVLVVGFIFAVGLAATPGQIDSVPRGYTNPFPNKGLSDAGSSIGGLLFLALMTLSMVTLVRRFRRSSGDEHAQMKWLVFGVGVAVVSLAVTIVASLFHRVGGIEYKIFGILVLVSYCGIAVSVGIAILTRRLYDIDVVINRTFVFGALAGFITIVYLGVVVGIGAAIGNTHNLGLSVSATVIVALSVQPFRIRANRAANRVVFGKRATPYEALSAFGERLAGSTAPGDTLPELARLVGDATGVVRSSVWLAVGASLVPAASWPGERLEPANFSDEVSLTVPGFDHVFPVRHQGELLGAIAIAESPAEPLSQAQRKLLSDLASQASLVLRNGRLIAELQASRQRLVATADQERRRIERNLHDGAQQHLVALSVKIGLLGQFMKADTSKAEALLADLGAEARDALENLRDLARGIYPPVLADQGLVAALQAQAHRSPLSVTVRAAGIERYTQEVEAAVYFCVLEALQNVAKYSGSSTASVDLKAPKGELEFSIHDDGAGFDVRSAKRGSGLTNMSDRLEALGGTVDVRSRPGEGTTVTGRVPAGH